MNMNQKKQKLNKGIGIAVAILLALTLFVTIIAFSTSKRTKDPIITVGSTNTTSTTSSTVHTTTSTSTTEAPSTQTGANELSFICPVQGTMIKSYSADIPVFSLTMEDYRVHTGIDISADAGTQVMASANGTITKVEFDPLMGQTVEITHDGDYVTTYRNLQTKMANGIEVGASVTAGDIIGYVGDTALVEISDSPHLHFEITKEGKIIDPLSLVKFESIDTSTEYED
jgi:murein DD-endopeptidase MepM/ murein hydrolase activator NlpD